MSDDIVLIQLDSSKYVRGKLNIQFNIDVNEFPELLINLATMFPGRARSHYSKDASKMIGEHFEHEIIQSKYKDKENG